MRLWIATFTDTDGHYLAVGRDNVGMRVYRIETDADGEPVLTLTLMSFPTCLRFVNVQTLSDTRRRDLDWLTRRYGEPPLLLDALDAEQPFEPLPLAM